MSKKPKSFYLLNDPCFECHSEYVHVLPSYSDCQNCLKLRMAFLDATTNRAPPAVDGRKPLGVG